MQGTKSSDAANFYGVNLALIVARSWVGGLCRGLEPDRREISHSAYGRRLQATLKGQRIASAMPVGSKHEFYHVDIRGDAIDFQKEFNEATTLRFS